MRYESPNPVNGKTTTLRMLIIGHGRQVAQGSVAELTAGGAVMFPEPWPAVR
jgi:hypothetical protein